MSQPSNAIKVPHYVYEDLEFIRASGITNMFAYNTVKQLCQLMEFHDTYEWLSQNKAEYVRGICQGIESNALSLDNESVEL